MPVGCDRAGAGAVHRQSLLAPLLGCTLGRPPPQHSFRLSPSWPLTLSTLPARPPACLPAALHCWKVFADRMRCDVGSEAQVAALMGDSLLRLQDLAPDDFSFRHPPSIQVCSRSRWGS